MTTARPSRSTRRNFDEDIPTAATTVSNVKSARKYVAGRLGVLTEGEDLRRPVTLARLLLTFSKNCHGSRKLVDGACAVAHLLEEANGKEWSRATGVPRSCDKRAPTLDTRDQNQVQQHPIEELPQKNNAEMQTDNDSEYKLLVVMQKLGAIQQMAQDTEDSMTMAFNGAITLQDKLEI